MKPTWKNEALCLGVDTDIWFDPDTEDLAVAICRDCPVRLECLKLALATQTKHGVWGGTTARERSAIVRQLEDGRSLKEVLAV